MRVTTPRQGFAPPQLLVPGRRGSPLPSSTRFHIAPFLELWFTDPMKLWTGQGSADDRFCPTHMLFMYHCGSLVSIICFARQHDDAYTFRSLHQFPWNVPVHSVK